MAEQGQGQTQRREKRDKKQEKRDKQRGKRVFGERAGFCLSPQAQPCQAPLQMWLGAGEGHRSCWERPHQLEHFYISSEGKRSV